MQELFHNEWFVIGMASIVIFAITQLLKYPIKWGTKHFKNEQTRKMVNATILLIPFAFGVLIEFLYCKYISGDVFTVYNGLGYGASAISVYGLVERFFKVKIANPYDSKEGEQVIELVDNVSKDGKLDSTDTDHIKEFWKKIN